MRHGARLRSWLSALALTVAMFFLNAAPAAAQCVICYTSAAGAGSQGIRALQIGILVLLVPTLTMLAGVLWLAYSRRNPDPSGSEIAAKDPNWEEGLLALRVHQETGNASPRL